MTKRNCPVIYGNSEDYINYIANKMIKYNCKKYSDYERLSVEYSKPFTDFNAFRDMYNTLQYKAHFTNIYEGPLVVDISGWNGHENESYFDILISFFCDYQHIILPVFVLNVQNKCSDLTLMINKINQYFNVTELNLCTIKKGTASLFIKDTVNKYSICCTDRELKRLTNLLPESISDINLDKICTCITDTNKIDFERITDILKTDIPRKNEEYSMGLLGGI